MRERSALLVGCLVVGCRVDFDEHAGPIDAVPQDAPACKPLPAGETMADCTAAYADPAMATDQLLVDCATSCAFGACEIHGMCPTCACPAYAYSSTICDAAGQCGAPLSGTGCIGLGFYSGAPFNCPSTNGVVAEGACMLRYLAMIGDC